VTWLNAGTEVAPTGEDLDSDGCTVDFNDRAETLPIPVAVTVSLTAEPDDYTALLANIAPSCEVEGGKHASLQGASQPPASVTSRPGIV